jgi:hypothetical protein
MYCENNKHNKIRYYVQLMDTTLKSYYKMVVTNYIRTDMVCI